MACDVCKKNPEIGVACIPGLPMSVAYCAECLQANAHPWGALVAGTAMLGGLDNAADWWKEMVACTCMHLEKSMEEFNAAVAVDLADLDAYQAQQRDSGGSGQVTP